MKNQPFLVAIFIAITVVFIVVGASLVAKLSMVTKQYNQESLKSMSLAEENELLKGKLNKLTEEKNQIIEENKKLAGTIKALQDEVANLKVELEKVNKIKEVFEERLKEELTKQQLPMPQVNQ